MANKQWPPDPTMEWGGGRNEQFFVWLKWFDSAENFTIFLILMIFSVNNPIKGEFVPTLCKKTNRQKNKEKWAEACVRPLITSSSNTLSVNTHTDTHKYSSWGNQDVRNGKGKQKTVTYRFFVGGRWREFDLQNILEVVQDAGVRVPASRPQTAPSLTLINHMQMSLQRHWGMIRRHSPLVFKKHLRCFTQNWDLSEVRHLDAKSCSPWVWLMQYWYWQKLNWPWAGGFDIRAVTEDLISFHWRWTNPTAVISVSVS